MRFFEKFSKERYTPLYPFQKGIKGYNVFSLPVSFQDFTFEIQRALFRCFDWMKLPAFCKVNDVLPGATYISAASDALMILCAAKFRKSSIVSGTLLPIR